MNNLYLDGTATTKPSQLAIDTFTNISRYVWGNPSSTNYDIGISAKQILNKSREMIARLISAEPEQIFFTSGSTEAANWIMQRIDRKIFYSNVEHPCIYNTGRYLEYIYPMSAEEFNPDDFEEVVKKIHSLNGKEFLICMMDSNNETGHLYDTRVYASLAHSHGGYLFTDMTQSFAHSYQISMDVLQCDFACASAHKFGGLKGTGFAYIKNPKLLKPLLYGGSQENGLRAGTENVAGIYAMALAFEKTCEQREEEWDKLKHLRSYLLNRLNEYPIVYGINGLGLPGILSLTFPGYDANMILSYLALRGIYLSAGSACSTGENKPSRILLNSGLSESEARSTIRITLYKDMTNHDIDCFIKNLWEVLQCLNTA